TMTMRLAPFVPLVLLAACATTPRQIASPPTPVEVQILAFNDFHGNLEPPGVSIGTTAADGQAVTVPAGGVAHLAAKAGMLRQDHAFTVTVSAGDMIGAAPLISSLYLDEPTIAAMNLVGVEFNAVGNHEFDKGSAELVRMQAGGCEKHTQRTPCAIEPFKGATFKFLAANVVRADGTTLFPGTAIKDFGPVQVGFIGMTLKETATLVTPAGVAGLTFADEAATANAAVPALRGAGADAIVLLIHQGGRSSGGYNDKSCPDFDGDIVPILDKLDPAIDVVVSGHTHAAYICERPRAGGKPLLLTSAGRYGTLISDIRLTVDPAGGVAAHRADNVIVRTDGPADAAVGAIVAKYAAAAKTQTERVVGRLSAPLNREPTPAREISGGDFIADVQLAATRAQGAQIAFSNSGGVRADINPGPDGAVTYGQIAAMQPFGNVLIVKALTGAQLKALLEQQFDSGTNKVERPNMLLPSKGFLFAYDLSKPAGRRIVEMKLDGKAIDPAARYRVTVVNFLATGGDNFTVLMEGTDTVDTGIVDVDATEAYLKAGGGAPVMGRIEDRTPKT
ncbi:MAG: bifunctional metallophosphatase/5'-nucleotidase, partial [Sphingomicrobium sp.]